MLTIGLVSAGQEQYYVGLSREDYYTESGEPEGQWFGRGAGQLGLTGTIDKADLSKINSDVNEIEPGIYEAQTVRGHDPADEAAILATSLDIDRSTQTSDGAHEFGDGLRFPHRRSQTAEHVASNDSGAACGSTTNGGAADDVQRSRHATGDGDSPKIQRRVRGKARCQARLYVVFCQGVRRGAASIPGREC